ncbi:hypothetical protein GIY62_02360 [Burkholderia plantarii]|uniref:hypothetical protein n=1 Tax=Burkholderia plantarii TaxID=41899 RepID=UPI00272AF7BC|nr:hypothetical protein [Burkholderia plantarii]WLE59549.1 hypothetical protein GIY62_02360 [Burkholderia plantarii]
MLPDQAGVAVIDIRLDRQRRMRLPESGQQRHDLPPRERHGGVDAQAPAWRGRADFRSPAMTGKRRPDPAARLPALDRIQHEAA